MGFSREFTRLILLLWFLVFADVLLQLFSIGVIRFFPEEFFVFDNGLLFLSLCVEEPAVVEMARDVPEFAFLVQLRNRFRSFIQT